MGCGDLAAQCLAHSYDGTLAFDAVRTLRFTGYGALFGPANGRWYRTSLPLLSYAAGLATTPDERFC